jgi:hypothetical protein
MIAAIVSMLLSRRVNTEECECNGCGVSISDGCGNSYRFGFLAEYPEEILCDECYKRAERWEKERRRLGIRVGSELKGRPFYME